MFVTSVIKPLVEKICESGTVPPASGSYLLRDQLRFPEIVPKQQIKVGSNATFFRSPVGVISIQ